MQLFLQLSKLQGTTSYFDENVGRVRVKSDTAIQGFERRSISMSATVRLRLVPVQTHLQPI